ncbi:hypothetical protein [Methanobacterium sp. BAmetb5]|jgi:hypothetical protein|uniref:hypothetical protein n=1 Tax=Methanobacterium sp. BAmetb5 TaxID=2025351 RepID=UPI0025DBD458|nr:hypothetical protein [Methanobacterium sp. BAmetb5]
MGDILGIGKIVDANSGSIPADCEKNGSSVIVKLGGACNKTDCPLYGTWSCPFSW